SHRGPARPGLLPPPDHPRRGDRRDRTTRARSGRPRRVRGPAGVDRPRPRRIERRRELMTSGQARQIGVVGGGLMGSGIAEVAVRHGHHVVVRERDAAAVEAARSRIATSLERAIDAGKLEAAAADDALARLVVTTEWEALADRQLVVEAVPEDEAAKLETFAEMDR